MKPVKVSLSKLRLDCRNARRHSEHNIEEIMRSLQANEQYRPFVVQRSTGIIVVGNGMYEAMRRLGITEGWAEYRDLTDEQASRLALSDNRTAELAEWDTVILKDLLQDLGPDADVPGWSNDEIEKMFETNAFDASEADSGEDENERIRTENTYNLGEYDEERAAGFYQMPELHRCDYVPTDLIGFNYVLSATEETKHQKGLGVHFYIDDYQFERLWGQPRKYIEILSPFSCVLTPDFSLYMNMPMAMKIWNIYRSRLIGQLMQDAGLNVIPTLSWAEKETFDFCFDGIEPGGTVSVSTVGVLRDKTAVKIWKDGMDEAIKRLRPSRVVVYGAGDIDFNFPCEIVSISNHVTERMGNKKN
jgi:hypothetical protein